MLLLELDLIDILFISLLPSFLFEYFTTLYIDYFFFFFLGLFRFGWSGGN
jgi:hypothetical protein